MKIGDVLSGDTKKAIYNKTKKRRKKKKEKLSFKDIENLMGVHRDRYERGRGGALKRK
ncbi:MAG TPA: hypothetical protein VK253_03065 [Candidatus Binatia bacterium]|nr:hypothetical protein [Candidatus Binatia bacterium]